MTFLVDADVLSEVTQPAPAEAVIRWLRHHERQLVTSPIVLGELEFGILLLPSGRKRRRLQQWFAEAVQRLRLIDFDAQAASAWAALLARLRRRGLAMPIKDSMIAATALAHGLSVATGNSAHFRHAGVAIVNPFDA